MIILIFSNQFCYCVKSKYDNKLTDRGHICFFIKKTYHKPTLTEYLKQDKVRRISVYKTEFLINYVILIKVTYTDKTVVFV